MAYTTYATVIELLDKDSVKFLTDDAGAGAYASGAVNECIAWADNKIDGYCAAKYSVPFTTAPEMVADLSADLAIFRLYARRSFRVPTLLWENYQLNIRTLEQIAKGVISLQDGSVVIGGSAQLQIDGDIQTDGSGLDFSGDDNPNSFTGYKG